MASVLPVSSFPRPTASPDRPRQPLGVTFLIDRLSRAGTETQLLALIRGLDRERFRPSLVLLDGRDEASRSLEPTDCPVLRLGVTRLVGLRAIRAARRLSAFWREHRPDILQVYFLDSTYFGVPLARWCGIPKIVQVRNNLGYWRTLRHRVLGRLVRRGLDRILTNTEAGREQLVSHEGFAPDRVAVLTNGVDLEPFLGFSPPFASWTSRREVLRIGCVANLRPGKNIEGLLRAARRVCDRWPQVLFEVAGDGEQRDELQALHATLELGDRFRFRGSVADVPGFLRTLDVAVLPSHSEGMSNALLEYMAAGRAIVATDVGANAQVAHDGQQALIVPPGDPVALADAMDRLLADPAGAIRLGAAARRRVEAEFSRPAMVRQFETFFQSLIEKRRGS